MRSIRREKIRKNVIELEKDIKYRYTKLDYQENRYFLELRITTIRRSSVAPLCDSPHEAKSDKTI